MQEGIKIQIKPLTVNQVWQGRRFKTKTYKQYEELLLLILPEIDFDFEQKIELIIEAGFSNKCSDLDNILKPLEDVFQKKYNFNDRNIYRIIAEKKIVPKGKEYFYFNFKPYE